MRILFLIITFMTSHLAYAASTAEQKESCSNIRGVPQVYNDGSVLCELPAPMNLSLAADQITYADYCYDEGGKNDYETCMNAASKMNLKENPNVGTAKTGEENSVDPVQACANAAKETQSTCMAENDSGMNQVMQSANMLGRQMGMVSSADVSAACTAIGSLSQAANGALSVFKANCLRVVYSCETACAGSANAANLRICQQASQKAQGLDTDMLLMMYTANNAKKCKDLTSNPWDALCKANPSLAGCSTSTKSCTDATYAATSLICVCQANPSDPRCISYVNNNSGGGVDLGPGGSGASPNGNATDSLAWGSDDPGLATGASGDGGLGGGAGGAGGGGGSFSASGANPNSRAAANKGQGGGAAGSGANTKILNGYYGGGGVGGSAGSGGANQAAGGGAGGGKAGLAQGKIDLRQFLPGGKFDPKRGLAGIAGPDGITGPSSDLFAKVNIRYRAVLTSLRP